MSVRKSTSSAYNSTSVFVGGIPGSIEAQEVLKYFSRFGKIADIIIPPKWSNPSINNGYCYVVFDSEAARDEVVALRDHYLGSRRVTCKKYLPGNSFNSELRVNNERKLFVKFVPSWVSESKFRDYFSQFGELESYYMVKYKDQTNQGKKNNTSVGYLVYKDITVCQTLISRHFLKIGTKKMLVQRFDKDYNQNKALESKDQPEAGRYVRGDSEYHSMKPTQAGYSISDRKQPTTSGMIESSTACWNDQYRFNTPEGHKGGSLRIHPSLILIRLEQNQARTRVQSQVWSRKEGKSTESIPTLPLESFDCLNWTPHRKRGLLQAISSV